MAQLGELSERFEEFRERGVSVLAVAQEDESMDMMWTMLDALGGEVPFELATDLRRGATARYDRLTTYLLDASGRVLEIFPVHQRMWLPWDAVLERVDELEAPGVREER